MDTPTSAGGACNNNVANVSRYRNKLAMRASLDGRCSLKQTNHMEVSGSSPAEENLIEYEELHNEASPYN